MPRSSRKGHSGRQKRRAPSTKDVFTSPYERPMTAAAALGAAMIPQFRAQMPQRYSFRFKLTSGVAYSTGFTTTMLLDLYAIAAGGSSQPVRLFNNMKLVGLKIWQPPITGSENATGQTALVGIEFSPSTTAGFGGAPRVPYIAEVVTGSKYAHLAVKPRRTELASQWFSAQQASYVLWNMQAGAGSIFQVDVVATMVNGETPVTNAYTSALAKGTVGVTNFGVAGFRSEGLVDLVAP